MFLQETNPLVSACFRVLMSVPLEYKAKSNSRVGFIPISRIQEMDNVFALWHLDVMHSIRVAKIITNSYDKLELVIPYYSGSTEVELQCIALLHDYLEFWWTIETKGKLGEYQCSLSQELLTGITLEKDIIAFAGSQVGSPEQLKEVAYDIVRNVYGLTRFPIIPTYEKYIELVATLGKKAIVVKLADIQDHLSMERRSKLSFSLERRYLKARDELHAALGCSLWP